MYVHVYYVPETLNMVLFVPLVMTLVHVTIEDWLAGICNSDTSIGVPLILVLLISIAVTFPLITLIILFPLGISCVVNRRAPPSPMYSVLLQARIKLVKVCEPLIVQVKMTSSPRQAWLLLRRVLVNSWPDAQTALYTIAKVINLLANKRRLYSADNK